MREFSNKRGIQQGARLLTGKKKVRKKRGRGEEGEGKRGRRRKERKNVNE